MRLLAFTLLMTSLACAPGPVLAQESARAPIFRYISIEPFGRIELGGPFPQASTLGMPVAPGLFRLVGPGGRPVQFADTEAIFVELTEAERVRAFYFLYLEPGESLAEREASYAATLGPAVAAAYDSAGARVRRRRWADARTEFELLEVKSDSATRLLSALRDRAPAPARKPAS